MHSHAVTQRARRRPAAANDTALRAPLPPVAALLQRLPWRLPYRVANRIERTARRRLGAEGCTVARVGGRLRRVLVRPNLVAAKAGVHNLELVVDICERAGIGYLVTSGDGRTTHRVAVESSDWPRFIEELGAAGTQSPVYAAVRARNVRGRYIRWAELAGHRTIAAGLRTQNTVAVFQYLTTTPGAEILGARLACRVECWSRDSARGLAAPDRHPLGAYVSEPYQRPARLEVAGRELPSLQPFARSVFTDVDFPIDAVYLWVDGADPAWVERKRRALADRGETDPAAHSAVRFRDNGELRYSLRSLEQYAPWIRRVYLVTDDQVPDWLNVSHERLRLVSHRELFGDDGRCPSFNSHALGARLHHLDGLAEHYLHLNDDFFFGRPVSPTLFFHGNGLSKFFLSQSTLPWCDAESLQPHEAARRNVVELLARDFGRTPVRTFFHTPIPQRRSVLQELEKRYPEVFESTWASQFRSRSDFEVNSWLHHYYAYLTGQAVPGSIRYRYFSPFRPGDWCRMQRLTRSRDRDVFCINDDDDSGGEQGDPRIARWLDEYLPTPSSYEL